MARSGLRQQSAIEALVSERYWVHWPSFDELLALPASSLVQAFASLLTQEGLDTISRAKGLEQLSDDDQ